MRLGCILVTKAVRKRAIGGWGAHLPAGPWGRGHPPPPQKCRPPPRRPPPLPFRDGGQQHTLVGQWAQCWIDKGVRSHPSSPRAHTPGRRVRPSQLSAHAAAVAAWRASRGRPAPTCRGALQVALLICAIGLLQKRLLVYVRGYKLLIRRRHAPSRPPAAAAVRYSGSGGAGGRRGARGLCDEQLL